MAKARGYVSSNGLEVTHKPNQNIIPSPPDIWTIGYVLKKISFYNGTKCTVIINNTFKLSLTAGRGFESGYDDVPIYSFVIEEENTPYEFVASY